MLEARGSVLSDTGAAEGCPRTSAIMAMSSPTRLKRSQSAAERLLGADLVNVQPGFRLPRLASAVLLRCASRSHDPRCGGRHGASGPIGPASSFSGHSTNRFPTASTGETELLDYDEVERLAIERQPKMMSLPVRRFLARPIDCACFRQIADKVGACLIADIAHVAA